MKSPSQRPAPSLIPRFRWAAALLSLVAVPATAQAAIYVPPDVSPGQQYQLVFVSQGTMQGLTALFTNWNNFVQGEAALNPSLTGTGDGVVWNAIVSADTEESSDLVAGPPAKQSAFMLPVAARNNALVEAPVYRLDGTKVADGFADMWDGDLDAPINIDQFGALLETVVWTGSDPDGFHSTFPAGNFGQSFPAVGLSDQSFFDWISVGTSERANSHSVYALSALLTAPGASIPEPSTALLLVFGMTGLLMRRGR